MPAPSARHIEPLLTLTTPLAGTIAATSSLTGALTVTAAAAGTIASTSSLTGEITSQAALAGTIAATSSLTGALTNAGVNALSGTIAATSALTGAVSVRASLAGSIASQTTLTGDLSNIAPLENALEGTIAITSDLTGDLTSEEPPPPHVPTTRYAIHWFWEPGNHSEMPDTPKTCPECGAPVVVMPIDLEVYCRHYEADTTTANGTLAEEDCPYIATINDSNYAQPLAADILAGYVLTAPV